MDAIIGPPLPTSASGAAAVESNITGRLERLASPDTGAPTYYLANYRGVRMQLPASFPQADPWVSPGDTYSMTCVLFDRTRACLDVYNVQAGQSQAK